VLADHKESIKKNVQFILSHFSGQGHRFPRAITTLKSKDPVYINNEEEILQHFIESDFKECKINGYPFFGKEERDMDKLSPSLLFIDIDLSLCSVCKYPKRKLDYILNLTLNKIEKETHGIPTVIWTGYSYHICLPVRMLFNPNDKEKHSLEFVTPSKEFIPHANQDLTTEFIRFAAKYFTTNSHQKDSIQNNNYNSISTKSCFITVPETINTKNSFKAEIVQKWDGKVTNIKTIAPYFLDNIMQRKSEYITKDKK